MNLISVMGQPLARPLPHPQNDAHRRALGPKARACIAPLVRVLVHVPVPRLAVSMADDVTHAPGDITRLLHSARAGESGALRDALLLLHSHLRDIARRQLADEREGHTLETDGLVHEAFLRLEGLERIEWRDRQHLLSMAARTMRRVLIDYAEQRRALKRGGNDVIVTLDESTASTAAIDDNADDLHALDEALERLALLNLRQSRVVECRFFVGLSIEETAEALELSPATVKRDWNAARAWLNRELTA